MMHMKQKIIFFVLLVCMIFSFDMVNVYAEDTECTYAARAELNRIASEVDVGYDFVYDDNHNVIAFDITIYNITEKIYVTYTDGAKDSKTVNVMYGDTNNGIYTFRDPNINDIVTYSFSVSTNYYNCSDYIRRFELVKPMRNQYHYKDYCQDSRLEDYFYCQEWITKKISISEFEIKNRINRKLKTTQMTTTKCKDCEEENPEDSQIEKLLKLKNYLIITIIVAMLMDLFLMYRKIVNMRRSEL